MALIEAELWKMTSGKFSLEKMKSKHCLKMGEHLEPLMSSGYEVVTF